MSKRAVAMVVGLGVAFGVVLAAAGCAGSERPEARSTIQVKTGARPSTDVIALPGDRDELVARAIERLPEIVRRGMEQTGVPGVAVAVISNDEVVFSSGYGVRKVGSDLPITPETVFQVASVSKPLSATGVAAAIGESDGALSWETRISDLLPGFAFSDPMVTEHATLGDTFAHRTGLATHAGDDLEDLGFEQATILERLRLQPLSPFRSSYHYSNFGLTLGGEAVAAQRGESWQELMQELVFTPIGMLHSSTTHDDYLASENRAVLHAYVDGAFVPEFDRDPDPEAPAGGVSSTVLDLAQWVRVLLRGGELDGKTIADPEALTAAMSPQIVSTISTEVEQRPGHYGFGFNASPTNAGRMSLSHSGAFSLGAATSFQIVPDLDLGLVVLTNGAPVGLPEAISSEFFDLVQYGTSSRDWVDTMHQFFAGYSKPVGDLIDQTRPASPKPSPAAAQLVGTYANAYFGQLIVEQGAAGLVVKLGPAGATVWPMEAWDGAIYSYSPINEGSPVGSLFSATFTLGAEGAATNVFLPELNGQGWGTFTRE